MNGPIQAVLRRVLAGLGRDSSAVAALHAGHALEILLRGMGHRLRGWRHRPWLGSCAGALYVGRHARLNHRRHLYLGHSVKIEEGAEIHALSSHGVHLGDGVTVGRYASIRPSGYYGTDIGHGLRVGAHSAIGAFAWIGASGPVVIGEGVLMGPRVVILPENHNHADSTRPIREQGVTRLGVTIEDDCWLGADCKILAGVRVGRGAIVAAGAVVHRDVPAGHIVGGVPAKILKRRGANLSPARQSA
ncbi:MAG TPA: acyltransferase [Planctomycetota bacterium]|nr:acyltransferase [Planctomycetota bacterium]